MTCDKKWMTGSGKVLTVHTCGLNRDHKGVCRCRVCHAPKRGK